MSHKVLVELSIEQEAWLRDQAVLMSKSLPAVVTGIVGNYIRSRMEKDLVCPFCHDQNRIRELEEQIEDMKSCCICGKLGTCEVWQEAATPPIHNVNDAPCDEWELG